MSVPSRAAGSGDAAIVGTTTLESSVIALVIDHIEAVRGQQAQIDSELGGGADGLQHAEFRVSRRAGDAGSGSAGSSCAECRLPASGERR